MVPVAGDATVFIVEFAPFVIDEDVYKRQGKTRVNDTGEETFGLLYFAEITEFTKELHLSLIHI